MLKPSAAIYPRFTQKLFPLHLHHSRGAVSVTPATAWRLVFHSLNATPATPFDQWMFQNKVWTCTSTTTCTTERPCMTDRQTCRRQESPSGGVCVCWVVDRRGGAEVHTRRSVLDPPEQRSSCWSLVWSSMQRSRSSAASTRHQPCTSDDDLNGSEMQTFDLLSRERRTSGQEMLGHDDPEGSENSTVVDVEFQSWNVKEVVSVLRNVLVHHLNLHSFSASFSIRYKIEWLDRSRLYLSGANNRVAWRRLCWLIWLRCPYDLWQH